MIRPVSEYDSNSVLVDGPPRLGSKKSLSLFLSKCIVKFVEDWSYMALFQKF
jgi:hypothetical protein